MNNNKVAIKHKRDAVLIVFSTAIIFDLKYSINYVRVYDAKYS